ncbi:hypothetical protein EJB05_24034 [Eragrostis curvula]|uniref:FBD domain-containing protein n=1 Tax=Eragrostis curvula TaxID=38414 RepID=A0A5J9V850_9POAL|nr:hypothetical protein EJB05_24034 [Eragrostis curvula]
MVRVLRPSRPPVRRIWTTPSQAVHPATADGRTDAALRHCRSSSAQPPDPNWDNKRFLQLITCKFAKCDTMEVHMNARRHAFAPSLLYLLRKSPGLRKLVVELPRPVTMELGINGDPCTSDCPCSSPESYMMDNFTLGSLEEVVMMDFRGLPNHVEALIMLLGCNAPALKNVVVNMPADVPSISGETFQKINSFARPNIDVKFNVLSP